MNVLDVSDVSFVLSNVVVFAVWSALIVSGWVVMAWCRKPYLGPAEISSLYIPGIIRGLGKQG